MNQQRIQLLGLLVFTIPLMGCSIESSQNIAPALFDTKEEAELAAKKDFHCYGAHKMGDKWMPCEKHEHHHHK